LLDDWRIWIRINNDGSGKPKNLRIRIHNTTTVGSAVLEEEGKEAGLRGSPLYMAPEIILKRTYDAKEFID
jgi:hypothetical protein